MGLTTALHKNRLFIGALESLQNYALQLAQEHKEELERQKRTAAIEQMVSLFSRANPNDVSTYYKAINVAAQNDALDTLSMLNIFQSLKNVEAQQQAQSQVANVLQKLGVDINAESIPALSSALEIYNKVTTPYQVTTPKGTVIRTIDRLTGKVINETPIQSASEIQAAIDLEAAKTKAVTKARAEAEFPYQKALEEQRFQHQQVLETLQKTIPVDATKPIDQKRIQDLINESILGIAGTVYSDSAIEGFIKQKLPASAILQKLIDDDYLQYDKQTNTYRFNKKRAGLLGIDWLSADVDEKKAQTAQAYVNTLNQYLRLYSSQQQQPQQQQPNKPKWEDLFGK